VLQIVTHAPLYEPGPDFPSGLVRMSDFARLFDEHADALFGFLAYRTGDRALAEDLVADTFERALRARRRFDRRRASEKTWLYAIALNLLRDQARRGAAERRALERAPVPVGGGDPDLVAVEDRDQLQRAMELLGDEEREALSLRYGADLKVAEIARVLGVPRTTVEGRIYGALRKLRSRAL
jgi:RNA polymerase sigma-70 factor, ECF subfamily